MAVTITGYDGTCTAADHTLILFAWQADIQTAIYRTDGFGDAFWSVRAGFQGLTGTIQGRIQTVNDPGLVHSQASAGSAFVLTASTGDTLSFTGYMSNIVVTIDRYNFANSTFTANFISSGTVTQAWI